MKRILLAVGVAFILAAGSAQAFAAPQTAEGQPTVMHAGGGSHHAHSKGHHKHHHAKKSGAHHKSAHHSS